MLLKYPACVIAILLFLALHAGGAETPNVVLIMADDLGWGDVGFNGGRIIRTPHLDAMAKGALTFTRFYAASAVCSPTRASCITGRHPYRIGIPGANSGHIKPPELTLAELLKTRGYMTGHFGKWHLGTLTKTVRDSNRGGPGGVAHYAPPWDNGFDRCFSTEAKVPTYDPMLKPRKGASAQGWDYVEDDADTVSYGTHYWNERGEMVTDNLRGDDSRVIMDRVVPFVDEAAKAGKPFFAVVWFHAPHLPVVAGPRHAEMYARYDVYRKNYYGCVTAMDEQIGRLRATLRKAGVAENTIVTFCSDNGPEGNSTAPGSAGPLRGRKRDLFEGGVRVPGLIEWPAKIKGGQSTDIPAVTSDYLPTILDILGMEMPDDRPIDGVSLLPLIEGKMTARPTPIGFQYGGKVALTDNRWKIVRDDTRKNRGENKGKKIRGKTGTKTRTKSAARGPQAMVTGCLTCWPTPASRTTWRPRTRTSSSRWPRRSTPGANRADAAATAPITPKVAIWHVGNMPPTRFAHFRQFPLASEMAERDAQRKPIRRPRWRVCFSHPTGKKGSIRC